MTIMVDQEMVEVDKEEIKAGAMVMMMITIVQSVLIQEEDLAA